MTISEVRHERRGDGDDALRWLRDALWAPEADVELLAVGREDPRATWLARPTGTAPELLVPVGPRRASAAVSRRFWDGMPASRRARQWLGEAGLHTGVAQRVWPGRVALVGADTDLEDPDRSLLARLAVVLDQARLLAAVTARPGHYNGKPVLQLFSTGGDPLAFAKVAVDELTEGYVRNELEWLARAGGAPAPLRVPGVLAEVDWRGRTVAVLEPLELPRRPAPGAPGLREALDAAVLTLGPVGEVAVGETTPVRQADGDLADLRRLVVGRHDGAVVEVGPWHGDLSPWNRVTRGHQVLLWDWELAGEGLPVGSDRRHERVMVATHLLGWSADAALGLLDPGEPAAAVYLLEMARRDALVRRSGRVDVHHGLGEAAARRLRRGLSR